MTFGEEHCLPLARGTRKSATLIIAESETAVTNLFAQNAVLLSQVFDGALLMLIEPARETCDKNMPKSLSFLSDLLRPTFSARLGFGLRTGYWPDNAERPLETLIR